MMRLFTFCPKLVGILKSITYICKKKVCGSFHIDFKQQKCTSLSTLLTKICLDILSDSRHHEKLLTNEKSFILTLCYHCNS